MAHGTISAICIAPTAGAPMERLDSVEALAGCGLWGDRYASAKGSWNKAAIGKRQVTLIHARFVDGSGFTHAETRRNLLVRGDVELMWLIGREFTVGSATFRGVKYCDPCMRPAKLAQSTEDFPDAFFDRGGLIAEITKGAIIKVGDSVIPPSKNY